MAVGGQSISYRSRLGPGLYLSFAFAEDRAGCLEQSVLVVAGSGRLYRPSMIGRPRLSVRPAFMIDRPPQNVVVAGSGRLCRFSRKHVLVVVFLEPALGRL